MGQTDSPPSEVLRSPTAHYRILPADEEASGILARACGLSATAAQVLLHRGVREIEEAQGFVDATLRGLSSPEPMADRALTAERLAAAIRQRERIVVFGDYDVDGTTSAVILSEVIEKLGGDVQVLVADRFHGGYGLSDPALDRCLSLRPSLIVTCDCGSSDHARIARARGEGVDVVVIDHHLVPEEPLPAMAFLNPHRPDCGFPYEGLCSAGLAFSVGAALRQRFDSSLDMREWLDLVALGTIADLAPLTGDNRRLVRAGLKGLGVRSLRPGLRALRRAAGFDEHAKLTARDVAFRLAPRLNAPGRLGQGELTLKLLQAKTPIEAHRLADEVERLNSERRRLTEEATVEAIAQATDIYGDSPSSAIVVSSDAWHRGIVGIVAARLVDRFGVPAVVIAVDGERGHGSARTVDDFDVHRALAGCASELDGWGGHRAAAGLSIAKDRVDRLRAAFADAGFEPNATGGPERLIDVALGGVYRVPSVDDLDRLGPFGQEHPAPRFIVDARLVETRAVGADGDHAKLKLRVGPDSVRAFAPRLFAQLRGLEQARLVGEFQPDHFIGGGAVEFLVTDVLN